MDNEEKYIVAFSENNKINVWNAAESSIKHTYELDADEKGYFKLLGLFVLIRVVKAWDLSEENNAAILFGKKSLRVFDLNI